MQPGPQTRPVLIGLDAESIDPAELSMAALTREINLRDKPSFILRKMMSALETQRQKKGLGWSRPWNKEGMTVFLTHRHNLAEDAPYLELWRNAFRSQSATLPDEYLEFAESLWSDRELMAYTFYHNRVEGRAEYEGLTLSIGRKVKSDKTKRDRIDILLEDFRVNGAVDRIPDQARIILNPFSKWERHEKFSLQANPAAWSATYSAAVNFYQSNRDIPARQWNHWAFRYIDYFGPRNFISVGSAFT